MSFSAMRVFMSRLKTPYKSFRQSNNLAVYDPLRAYWAELACRGRIALRSGEGCDARPGGKADNGRADAGEDERPSLARASHPGQALDGVEAGGQRVKRAERETDSVERIVAKAIWPKISAAAPAKKGTTKICGVT